MLILSRSGGECAPIHQVRGVGTLGAQAASKPED